MGQPMKESDGCKKEVMGSQQNDERWLQNREEKKAQKMPKSGCKKCPKRLKMEEKKGSKQSEKLVVKNRKMGQPNKENDGCKKWGK